MNDAKSLFDYIKKMLLYEISPVVHKIKCPTLITYSPYATIEKMKGKAYSLKD